MLKFSQIYLQSLLGFALQVNGHTPLDGKFFYLQLNAENSDGYHGLHYVDFQVGSKNQSLQFWLSSEEHSLGIFSSKCANCIVQNKFNEDQSTTAKKDAFKSYKTEQVSIFDQHDHQTVQFVQCQGNSIEDQFHSVLQNYDRITSFSSIALIIDQVDKQFTSQYSGYMGIAPYFGLPDDQKERSFLKSLKEKGKIEHMVVSFFNRPDSSAVIKFGSYDQAGLQDVNQLVVFKTFGKNSWKLQTSYVDYAERDILKQTRDFLIEPQLPYLYISPDDFLEVARALSRSYKDDIICGSGSGKDNNKCYFKKSCNQVDNKDYQMKITIQGAQGQTSQFIIDQKDLLISGKYLGQGDNFCFVAIFVSYGFGGDDSQQSQSWYVGNLFLQKYYVFFDMTPADEHGQDYLQIGIGPANPIKNILLEQQYNPATNVTEYLPEDKSDDVSESISGNDTYNNTEYEEASKERERLDTIVEKSEIMEFFEGKKLILLIVFSVIIIFFVVFAICLCCCQKKKKKNLQIEGKWVNDYQEGLQPKVEEDKSISLDDSEKNLEKNTIQ